jgi:DNA-binding NtrC family response regulator
MMRFGSQGFLTGERDIPESAPRRADFTMPAGPSKEPRFTICKRGRENLVASLLVVDDDRYVRDVLYDLFADVHRCHTTDSAEKALALLDEEFYDVVLTDISMPGLSGLELLGRVRQRYPDTPVIIISGITDQEHERGLMKLGAFDYVLKPFHLATVEESVKRALAYRSRALASR